MGHEEGGVGGHDGGGAGHHVVWGGASLPAGNWSVRKKKKAQEPEQPEHGLTWIDGPSTLAHSLPERLLQQIPHHGVKATKKGRV
jgi:hypothetical protein